MSILGPLSEGNLIPRTFFEQWTLASLVALVGSQWEWIIFVVIGVAGYATARQEKLAVSIHSHRFGPVYLPVLFLTWFASLNRLILGSSTNLAAIFLSYGDIATEIAIGFLILLLADFLLIFWRLGKAEVGSTK